jgi:hypothetical protein
MTSPYATPTWSSGAAVLASDVGRSGPAIRLRAEAVVAVLVAAYSVMLGEVMGLIWPRVAPHIEMLRALEGSEAAAKAVLGDDMWFALLGIVAGLVAVGILLLVGRGAARGPGAVLGLAVGGVLGSLVAAHLGHQIQHPSIVAPRLVADLKALAPRLSHHQILGYLNTFDFTLRADAMLLAWPMTAVIVHAASLVVRSLRLGTDD